MEGTVSADLLSGAAFLLNDLCLPGNVYCVALRGHRSSVVT